MLGPTKWRFYSYVKFIIKINPDKNEHFCGHRYQFITHNHNGCIAFMNNHFVPSRKLFYLYRNFSPTYIARINYFLYYVLFLLLDATLHEKLIKDSVKRA